MKHLLLLLVASLFSVPTCLYAQATKSIPLGKKGSIGLDTHIPVQANMAAVNASINRQLAAAQAAYHPRPAMHWAAQPEDSLGLTKEDLSNDTKDYVVTPEGDIKKGSWQACEYFYKWQERQQQLHAEEEQVATQREMLLLQFDISDEYCRVLAQQYQPAPVRMDLTQLHAQPITTGVTAIDVSLPIHPTIKLPEVNTAQAASITQPTSEPSEKLSLTELGRGNRVSAGLPSDMTPRKAKRYLKHFVREHYAELSAALTARQQGQRLGIGQRRLLSSYSSLCFWYEETHPEPCPEPETFL